MTTPQFFEISGQKFAAIPVEIYNDLVEDSEMLSDIESYKKAKDEENEYIPFELTERMLDGENPIKVFREYRKITQAFLAKEANLSRNYIAELELGKKNGSVSALKSISKVLDVSIDDLV